jgi:LEA14-like dessication related protein
LDASARAMVLFFVIVLVLLIGVALFDQESTPTSGQVLGISVLNFQPVGLQAVNASGSTIVVTFTIKNTTPVGATLLYATYKLYGDGNYVGKGAITSPVKIPAHSSVQATTDFLLPLEGAIRGSWAYFLYGGNISWRAQGNATIIEPILGALSVQFNCKSIPESSSISCSYLVP